MNVVEPRMKNGLPSNDDEESNVKMSTNVKLAQLFEEGKLTRAELREIGRSIRKRVPFRRHSLWKPDPQRPNPVDILRSQEAIRVKDLIPIRYGRMAATPFAFFRGAAAVMAWDLARTPTSGLQVQICGDAHVENFGAYASPERRIVFDINDFDETLAAPWEYDVKRMAVSILLAARNQNWGDKVGLDSVRSALRCYCKRLDSLTQATTLDIHYAHAEASGLIEESDSPDFSHALSSIFKTARKRTQLQVFKKIVTRREGRLRFVENPPLLVRLSDSESEHFHQLINTYRDSLQDNRRHVLLKYRFRDVARNVVGVGSVGLLAYVILMEGRGDPDPLLIQVKQAVSSVLTPYWGKSGYERHGQRVVVGQRLMQAVSDPFLGWVPFAQHDFYVRQLRDMKGQIGPAESAAVFKASMSLCGATLARAHARSVDPALLNGYLNGTDESFVKAITAFARAYADQAECDHKSLVNAIRKGVVKAVVL